MFIYEQKYNVKYRDESFFFSCNMLNDLQRKFIQGGRVQCKLRINKEPMYYLDANSLYPSAMIKIKKRCEGYYILDKNAVVLDAM